MGILLWPHDSLKQVCVPVTREQTAEAMVQLDAMKIVAKEAGGVGLAANQVGLDKRMLVAFQPGTGWRGFVNPIIREFTGKWIGMREGCLSLPGFYETVKRNTMIVVEYVDLETWRTVVEPMEGKLAHILQHEVEHLDGIMFTDKLKSAQRDQLRAYLRKNRRAA